MTWLWAGGILIGSAVLSFITVGISITVARRYGWYDHPDGGRKQQGRPIPKLGGVAVALAFTLTVCGVLVVLGRAGDALLALGVLGPALAAALLGSVDDYRHLNPWLRLVLQAGLAAAAWVLGTRIDLFHNTLLDGAVFVVWVVLVVNGINLLDNSDGLAGSSVLIAAVGATIIAATYGQILVSTLGVAIVGVSIGFLLYNWHPARVYLGDGGAYFLGFLLALLTVRVRPSLVDEWQGVLVAALLVALPLVDTGFVTVTRLRRGTHPFTAGRDHLSHRLQGRGLSVPGSVLVLDLGYLVCVALGVLIAILPRVLVG